MPTRYLELVRHGQYERKGDRSTEHLTPFGVEQAQLTAQRLRSLPIRTIHCSSLPRAVETAQIIAQIFPGIPLHKTRLLWECFPCVPPNVPGFAPKISAEKIAEHRKQAESAFGRYFKRARGQDKWELLVCHGNIIRYFACRVLQVPLEACVNMGSDKCGISQVTIESDGKMWLFSYNDIGHLPHLLAVC